jgi:hypothetical protein
MELLGKLMGMLSGKKSLQKITIDELRKERLRLEQVEQRVGREVDDLEKRKQQLFVKGKDETSQRQQIAIARKIKELDAGGKGKDRQLAMISRQVRILSGLSAIKENESLVKELGVSSVVSRMDLDELQKYVEQATVEGQFQMERFAQILKTMESPDGVDLAGVEDEDTMAIVAAMQEARSAEVENPAAAETGMKKVDQILAKSDKEGEAPEPV